MPSVPDRKTVARRRALVSQIKEFGQKEFGLPRTRNFSGYYPDKSWCFFVQWCSKDEIWEKDEDVDEKLFFDKTEAVDFYRQKVKEGFDAFVYKAQSFTDEKLAKTSGSPLTPLHISMSHVDMATLIFHEDFHIWIKRSRLKSIMADSKIEESLADVFGEIATVLWAKNARKNIDHQKFFRERIKEAVMVCRVRELLERVYKNVNLSAKEKDLQKRKIFKKYKNEILGANKEWCYYKKVNFASLYVNYLYNKHTKLFYDFFRSSDGPKEVDLRIILERIKIISRKSNSPDDFISAIKKYTNRNHKKLRK